MSDVTNSIVWARIYSSKTLYPITGSTKHSGVVNQDEATVGTLIDSYDESIKAQIEADLETVKGWINSPES